ncbi:MAG: hypothetical protein F4Y87_02255 [Synechococcus sp. SB0665_bin_28]|nr:hypothetical protein [Synechococcus sp. SB0665_bin_28]
MHGAQAGPQAPTPPAPVSATWRGSPEAGSTADLLHLSGTVRLHIPELRQPLLDAHINLEDDGHTVPLRWRHSPLPTAASTRVWRQSTSSTAASPGHAETWGLFHTDAFLAAFGAKRHRQAPAAQ